MSNDEREYKARIAFETAGLCDNLAVLITSPRPTDWPYQLLSIVSRLSSAIATLMTGPSFPGRQALLKRATPLLAEGIGAYHVHHLVSDAVEGDTL